MLKKRKKKGKASRKLGVGEHGDKRLKKQQNIIKDATGRKITSVWWDTDKMQQQRPFMCLEVNKEIT